tara:strand:- start:1162 stop:1320 length:159 start_codon:yes stop_codon:yes gene_type:complete
MNNSHVPSFIGTAGTVGTFTLASINQIVAIAVGIFTLIYLSIRIYKELKNGK